MKQKDIVLIIVIVLISGALSLLISKKVFSTPASRQEKVEVVEPIVADFNKPTDKDKHLNRASINPTRIIKIGENNNQQPFKKQ